MKWKIIFVTCITIYIILTYTYFKFTTFMEYSYLSTAEQTYMYMYSKQLVEKCNSEFLRKAFFKNNMSYTEGSWVNDTWKPSNCEFSNNKSILHKCLPDLKVRKILILGDSNGRRWGDAALRLLLKEFKCYLVKQENDGNPNPTQDYFKDVNDSKFRKRDCSTCTSFLYQCIAREQSTQYSHNATNISQEANAGAHNASVQAKKTKIDLEYLVMEYYMDNEMTTERRLEQCKNAEKIPFTIYGSKCGESMTTQQYIFNEYLYTQNNYPTLILIIGNHHEPERRGYSDLKRDLTWFLELLQQVVHNNTRVYWIEPTYVTNNWKGNPKTYEKYKNWALQVISQYYKSNPNLFYPFYGTYDLSKNKTDWHEDGMHYITTLYTSFMELFFKTLCE